MKVRVGKCGAIPSRHDPRTIPYKAVAKGITARRPYRAPPPAFDARPRGMRWPMLGNDTYGNCTFAAIVRIMIRNAFTRGRVLPITDKDVVDAYLDMNDGKDVGAMPIDALAYMRNVGVKGCKVVAFARVDDNDPLEQRSAMKTFSSLYVAAGLPLRLDDDRDRRWELTPINQRTSRDAPRSMGGHAFPEFGYQRDETFAVPWDQEVVIEAAWEGLYMEERWVFIDNQEDDEVLLAAMHEQLAAIKAT